MFDNLKDTLIFLVSFVIVAALFGFVVYKISFANTGHYSVGKYLNSEGIQNVQTFSGPVTRIETENGVYYVQGFFNVPKQGDLYIYEYGWIGNKEICSCDKSFCSKIALN